MRFIEIDRTLRIEFDAFELPDGKILVFSKEEWKTFIHDLNDAGIYLTLGAE